jgi:hypothetical protein
MIIDIVPYELGIDFNQIGDFSQDIYTFKYIQNYIFGKIHSYPRLLCQSHWTFRLMSLKKDLL